MNDTQRQEREDWYFSDMEKTLSLARSLYRDHGARLSGDQDVGDGLARVRRHERALNLQMQRMDMGKRCGRCAAREGGGCCSAYMGGNADSILLLINMLLQKTVAFQHDNGIDCRYLGATGCILPIKPIFCLNYNCSHIRDAATNREMARLEGHAAGLLSAQTELETMLVDLLHRI